MFVPTSFQLLYIVLTALCTIKIGLAATLSVLLPVAYASELLVLIPNRYFDVGRRDPRS